MEAAGVCAALYQMPDAPSFVLIKGICDFADAKKDNKWQAYAADAASAFVASYVGISLSKRDLQLTPREQAVVVAGTDLRALRLALSEAYNLSELRVLASDLNVDWEDVAGPGRPKSEQIVELIWYLKRRGRFDNLVLAVKRDRPQLLESYVSPDVHVDP